MTRPFSKQVDTLFDVSETNSKLLLQEISISLNCSSVEAKRKPVAHIPRSTPASRLSSFAWKTHKYDVLRAINRMPKCLHSQGA